MLAEYWYGADNTIHICTKIQGNALQLDGKASDNIIYNVSCNEFRIAHRYKELFCNLPDQAIVWCDAS